MPTMTPAPFDLAVIAPDGTPLSVRVTRKRVRNLNLRVKQDGTVTLSAPIRCPVDVIEGFLNRKASWIAVHVRANELRAQGSGRDTGRDGRNGTGCPAAIFLWGSSTSAAGALRLDEADIRALSAEEFDERLAQLYKTEILRALPPVVERLETAMGVHATRWSVRPMKTRWGSCTPKTGVIRIASGLAAYPPTCLEFVVAHELVHLLEPSHNARFHTLLDRYCPDNREIGAMLRHSPAGH